MQKGLKSRQIIQRDAIQKEKCRAMVYFLLFLLWYLCIIYDTLYWNKLFI